MTKIGHDEAVTTNREIVANHLDVSIFHHILSSRLQMRINEKLTLTIEEAVEYSNIGQNKLRELTNMPFCPFVLYIGKKRLIKRKEFEEYISAQKSI